ncbi:MAG: 3-octaprenyl-4-hydroxybenzoate decarboxylase, partial [Candidatus Binatia bacterium]
MPTLDLRNYLALLQKHGELRSVTDAVDLRFELCEFLRQVDRAQGPALLFEQISGHSMKVVGNLVGTPTRLALAFGLKNEHKLLETYHK